MNGCRCQDIKLGEIRLVGVQNADCLRFAGNTINQKLHPILACRSSSESEGLELILAIGVSQSDALRANQSVQPLGKTYISYEVHTGCFSIAVSS